MPLCANVGQTGPGETDDSEINQMTLSSKRFELWGQSRYISITKKPHNSECLRVDGKTFDSEYQMDRSGVTVRQC